MLFSLKKTWDELGAKQRESILALGTKASESSVAEQWDNAGRDARFITMAVALAVNELQLTKGDFKSSPQHALKPNNFR